MSYFALELGTLTRTTFCYRQKKYRSLLGYCEIAHCTRFVYTNQGIRPFNGPEKPKRN